MTARKPEPGWPSHTVCLHGCRTLGIAAGLKRVRQCGGTWRHIRQPDWHWDWDSIEISYPPARILRTRLDIDVSANIGGVL